MSKLQEKMKLERYYLRMYYIQAKYKEQVDLMYSEHKKSFRKKVDSLRSKKTEAENNAYKQLHDIKNV